MRWSDLLDIEGNDVYEERARGESDDSEEGNEDIPGYDEDNSDEQGKGSSASRGAFWGEEESIVNIRKVQGLLIIN